MLISYLRLANKMYYNEDNNREVYMGALIFFSMTIILLILIKFIYCALRLSARADNEIFK